MRPLTHNDKSSRDDGENLAKGNLSARYHVVVGVLTLLLSNTAAGQATYHGHQNKPVLGLDSTQQLGSHIKAQRDGYRRKDGQHDGTDDNGSRPVLRLSAIIGGDGGVGSS